MRSANRADPGAEDQPLQQADEDHSRRVREGLAMTMASACCLMPANALRTTLPQLPLPFHFLENTLTDDLRISDAWLRRYNSCECEGEGRPTILFALLHRGMCWAGVQNRFCGRTKNDPSFAVAAQFPCQENGVPKQSPSPKGGCHSARASL